MTSAQNVEKAVLILYNTDDSSLLETALQVVESAQQSRDGWRIGFELLSCEDYNVRFAGANMLLQKMRLSWSDLDGREEKRDFCATLSHSYRSSLLKDASLPQERVTSFQSLVALALASAVTRCMAEGLLTADETFQQLRDSLLSDNACLIGLLLILEMIPQEKARICFVPRERETLSAAIDQLKDYVLELITQVRSMLPSVADRYAICDCHYAVVIAQLPSPLAVRRALVALNSWVDAIIFPRIVIKHRIFQLILGCNSESIYFPEAPELVKELVDHPIPRKSGETESRQLVRMVLESTVPMYERSLRENDLKAISAYAGICCSLARSNAPLFAAIGNAPETIKLHEILLSLLDHPAALQVAVLPLPYFERKSKSIPRYQQNEYRQLYEQVLRHLTKRPPLTDSNGEQDDEEMEFQRDIKEAYLACYKVLGAGYISLLNSALDDSRSLSEIEAVFYAIRCPAAKILDPPVKPAVDTEIGIAFSRIFNIHPGAASPQVCAAALKVVADFAKWFKQRPDELAVCIQFVAQHLQSSSETASNAMLELVFHNPKLAPQLAPVIYTPVASLMQQSHVSYDDKLVAAKCLALTLRSLSPSDAAEGVKIFLMPVAHALLSAMGQLEQAGKLEWACFSIKVIAMVLSVFDAYDGDRCFVGMVILRLLEMLFPHFDVMLSKQGRCGDDCGLREHCCRMLKHMFCAAPKPLARAAEPIVRLVTGNYCRSSSSACPPANLSVLSCIFRLYGDDQLSECFRSVVSDVSRRTFEYLRSALADHPDLVSAYFDLMSTFLQSETHVRHPLEEEIVEASVSLSISSLEFPERDAAKSVLEFLSKVCTVARLNAAVCQRILTRLFVCMDRGFSRGLSASISTLLLTMIRAQECGDPQQWVSATLQAFSFPRKMNRDLLLRVLLNPTIVKRDRLYRAMVQDLCRVMAGEIACEDLGIFVR